MGAGNGTHPVKTEIFRPLFEGTLMTCYHARMEPVQPAVEAKVLRARAWWARSGPLLRSELASLRPAPAPSLVRGASFESRPADWGLGARYQRPPVWPRPDHASAARAWFFPIGMGSPCRRPARRLRSHKAGSNSYKLLVISGTFWNGEIAPHDCPENAGASHRSRRGRAYPLKGP